jgi:hypothetical protein
MAGTSSGEILLINFENSQKDGSKPCLPYRIEKRLINDKQRQCNCLAWNPYNDNLVAAGYGKSTKGDQKSCLLIWDLNMGANFKGPKNAAQDS